MLLLLFLPFVLPRCCISCKDSYQQYHREDYSCITRSTFGERAVRASSVTAYDPSTPTKGGSPCHVMGMVSRH